MSASQDVLPDPREGFWRVQVLHELSASRGVFRFGD